jgi:hypothetical protein
MDLQQLVSTSFVVADAASVYGGFRLMRIGTSRAGSARPERPDATAGGEAGTAAFFIVLGMILLAVAGMLVVGPWRAPEPRPFPIRVMDLNIPPAAIERVPPKAPGS